MFEWLKDLNVLNADFVNGAASAATILATMIGILRYRQSRQKKIYYQWVRTNKVLPTATPGYKVIVETETGSGSSLITDTIVISNRTDVTVTNDDFVDQIAIKCDHSKTIYQSEVVDRANGATAELEIDGDCIQIKKLKIPRDSSVTIFLAHDSAVTKSIEATPKTLPNLEARAFNKAHQRGPVVLGSFILFGLFLYVFLFPLLDGVLPMIGSGWAGLGIGLSFIIFIPVCWFFIAEWLPPQLGFILRPLFSITDDEDRLSKDEVVSEIEKLVFSNQIQTSSSKITAE